MKASWGGLAAVGGMLLTTAANSQSISTVPLHGMTAVQNQDVAPMASAANAVRSHRARPRVSDPATMPALITPRVFIFEGNTVISTRDLSVLTASWLGQTLNLGALHGVADAVVALYRQRGFPHATAYFPEQKFLTGVVTIGILESTLGDIRIRQPLDPRLRVTEAEVKKIINAQIRPDIPVHSERLARTLMLVEDLAAVSVRSALRRSDEPGRVDLDLVVEPDRAKSLLKIAVEADNFGTPETGRGRSALKIEAKGLMHAADVLTLDAQVTSRGPELFGSARYGRPVGSSGVRAGVGAGKLSYSLGGEFAALEADGEAIVGDVFVSYPMVRSQDLTINGQIGAIHKSVTSTQPIVSGASTSVSGIKLRLSGGLRGFDHVNVFAVELAAGKVRISDPAQLAQDQSDAGFRTSGPFRKLTFEGQRQQLLGQSAVLHLKLSGQLASGNLPGVEKFSLGGPDRIRGHVPGEGSGDYGIAATIEVRMMVPGLKFGGGALMASAFYDIGRIGRNRKPENAAHIDRLQPNSRTMSSLGVGLRFGEDERLVVRAELAYPLGVVSTTGTTVQARNRPRLWVQSTFWF